MTYYYDGVDIGSVTSGITSAPMFLILSYAAGDPVPGSRHDEGGLYAGLAAPVSGQDDPAGAGVFQGGGAGDLHGG